MPPPLKPFCMAYPLLSAKTNTLSGAMVSSTVSPTRTGADGRSSTSVSFSMSALT